MVIKTRIQNCDVTIIPEVMPDLFNEINAFDVKVICKPAFPGSDKELMLTVCRVLTDYGDCSVEIKTWYVVRDCKFVGDTWIEEIVFQALTPLDMQWYS